MHATTWLGALALYIACIKWLWNWLMPSVTGWSSINFLQAAGMFLLMHMMSGTLIRVKHLWGWGERKGPTDEESKGSYYRMNSNMDNGLFELTTTVGDSCENNEDDDKGDDEEESDSIGGITLDIEVTGSSELVVGKDDEK